jgi:hypothetical protein
MSIPRDLRTLAHAAWIRLPLPFDQTVAKIPRREEYLRKRSPPFGDSHQEAVEHVKMQVPSGFTSLAPRVPTERDPIISETRRGKLTLRLFSITKSKSDGVRSSIERCELITLPLALTTTMSVIQQAPIDASKHDLDEKIEGPTQLEAIEKGAQEVDYHDRQAAMNAEVAEQSMTIREALRDYKSAVFWSWAISLCIIMEGYDTALPVSCHHVRWTGGL